MPTDVKTPHLRRTLPVSGTFISVPDAFTGVDEGLVHAVKMGVQVVRSETSSRPFHLENVVFNDVVLLDFGAVSPSALDFKKLARDCEILQEAFLNAPDEVLKIIAALQSGPSLTGITQALKIAQELGLTEEMAIQKGGGILAAVLVIGAILLLDGCGHYIQGGQVLGPTAPTSQPPDAGSGPSDAGAGPG